MASKSRAEFATTVSTVRDLLVTRQSAARTALAGLIGNVLEWFDFAVYGYFATDIGRQFFPQSSPSAQQLLAFAVFALGFVTRPMGSLVLGVIGDRIGRRALLTFSIVLMGAATLAIGLLPTYAQIGLVAPIALVTLRLVQGFSLGAEFTGSMVYTTEMASPSRRGLIGSSSTVGASIGFILGSGSAWLVRALSSTDTIDWQWRIPFIASVVLCVGGWFLRRGLAESAEGIKAASTRPPLLPSLLADWRPMIQTFGIGAMINAALVAPWWGRATSLSDPALVAQWWGRGNRLVIERMEPKGGPAGATSSTARKACTASKGATANHAARAASWASRLRLASNTHARRPQRPPHSG